MKGEKGCLAGKKVASFDWVDETAVACDSHESIIMATWDVIGCGHARPELNSDACDIGDARKQLPENLHDDSV